VQWQKKRPMGSPSTVKREAPQRQEQSWFIVPSSLVLRP
jgi:hypothetical protein